MRPLWILRFAAAVGALLLTAAGLLAWFVAPPSPWLYLLNPGALIVWPVWPEGIHSDAPLAGLFPLFLLAADLLAWWVILYFPLRWLARRLGWLSR